MIEKAKAAIDNTLKIFFMCALLIGQLM